MAISWWAFGTNEAGIVETLMQFEAGTTEEEALTYVKQRLQRNPDKCYTNLQVVDDAEYRRNVWWKLFGDLKPLERELVTLFFPNIHAPGRDMSTVKTPNDLYCRAKRKVVKLGFSEPCSRCGGSGNYSYCTMYGTCCFRCEGQKRHMPKLTKKLLGAIKTALAEQANQTASGKSPEGPMQNG